MLSVICQCEIDTLQNEIQRMTETIAVAQARISALGEIESVADGAIELLRSAVQKVSSLAPSAIASLKATVLSLFEDGGSGNDGDSPQDPIPDAPSGGDELPQPLEIIPRVAATCEPCATAARLAVQFATSLHSREQS